MGWIAGIGLTGCLFGWLAVAPALALPLDCVAAN